MEGIPQHQLQIASLERARQEKGYPSAEEVIGMGVPAGLAQTLAPFQRGGVDFVHEKNGRALIADDMGLGKVSGRFWCVVDLKNPLRWRNSHFIVADYSRYCVNVNVLKRMAAVDIMPKLCSLPLGKRMQKVARKTDQHGLVNT